MILYLIGCFVAYAIAHESNVRGLKLILLTLLSWVSVIGMVLILGGRVFIDLLEGLFS